MPVNQSIRSAICSLLLAFALCWGLSTSTFAQIPVPADGQTTEDATAKTDDTPAADAAADADAGGAEGNVAEGLEIYKANCQSCHKINEKVVGPALKGVRDRWDGDTQRLINFIKYPEKTINSGDAYAKSLYDEYQQYMPNHDFLTDAQVKSVLAWVDAGKDEGLGEGDPTTKKNPVQEDQTISSGLLIGIIVVLLGMLLISIVVLSLLGVYLSKMLKRSKEMGEDEEAVIGENVFDIKKILSSPGVVGIIAFVFIAFVAKTVLTGLFTIGVQQGYAPTQPIKFSHKLHAGYYEIDCQYCHTGAARGKSAGIPSANICMNCHNSIRPGSPEMQKIYTAVENNRPIQWVRVHNLPDLSYFNHSQHVKVAGLECQTCHGEIQEMEVVRQNELLTMGWCIACHRETEMEHAKENPYYADFVQIHEAYSDEPIHVEDIGGLECAKCHY